MFVSFGGIEGSGESTQSRRLADALREKGHEVVLTREPGGSPGAEEIRKLVLEGDPERWSPETELLLFTAARRDHLERLILPALAAGQSVSCDRFADSTRVYQGLRGPDMRQKVDMLHDLMIVREPDLTVLVDMDPEVGLARALGRQGTEERFEQFGADLQAQMRAGVLELAQAAPKRYVVVDGARTEDTVAREIESIVTSRLT